MDHIQNMVKIKYYDMVIPIKNLKLKLMYKFLF